MLPTITSSTCSGSRPDRLRTCVATVVPRSTAGTSLSVPPKVPMAVLKGVEITISVSLLPLPKFIVLLCFRYHLCGMLPPTRYPTPTQQSKNKEPNSINSLRPAALLFPVSGSFGTGTVEFERGAEELPISIHPFLREALEELLLPGDGFHEERPATLELITERFDDVLEEVLDELHVALLSLVRVFDNVAVCIQTLFQGPVGLLLTLERLLQGLHGRPHGIRQGPVALGLALVRLDQALRPVLGETHAPLLGSHGPAYRVLHSLQTCLRGVLRLTRHWPLLSLCDLYDSPSLINIPGSSASHSPHRKRPGFRPGLLSQRFFSWLPLRLPLGLLDVPLPEREHRVHEVHVSVD